eukprot:1187626-Prorocentrum_minimum.AAC.7
MYHYAEYKRRESDHARCEGRVGAPHHPRNEAHDVYWNIRTPKTLKETEMYPARAHLKEFVLDEALEPLLGTRGPKSDARTSKPGYNSTSHLES